MPQNKQEEAATAAKAAEPEVAAPEAAAPEAPAMPKMGATQILPMVAMLATNQFDIEKLGYTRHVEIAYVVVQVVCLAVTLLLYTRIQAMEDDGTKIQIKEVKQLGQVVKPATEQTKKDYDMSQWKESMQKLVMGCCVLGGVYYKWGSITVLVLQVVMTPAQLFESELVSIHFLGKDVKRPFPTANPFGLPQMPEPEPEQAAETKAVAEKETGAVEGDAAAAKPETKKAQ